LKDNLAAIGYSGLADRAEDEVKRLNSKKRAGGSSKNKSTVALDIYGALNVSVYNE